MSPCPPPRFLQLPPGGLRLTGFPPRTCTCPLEEKSVGKGVPGCCPTSVPSPWTAELIRNGSQQQPHGQPGTRNPCLAGAITLLNNYLVTGLQLCLAPPVADEHRGVWDEDAAATGTAGTMALGSPWVLLGRALGCCPSGFWLSYSGKCCCLLKTKSPPSASYRWKYFNFD